MEELKEVQENVETETTNVEETENNSENVVEEKTFTQDEVNAIVKERLAKEKKGIPSKEELAKYNEWKESQKSQQDKYDELVKTTNEKDFTFIDTRLGGVFRQGRLLFLDKRRGYDHVASFDFGQWKNICFLRHI